MDFKLNTYALYTSLHTQRHQKIHKNFTLSTSHHLLIVVEGICIFSAQDSIEILPMIYQPFLLVIYKPIDSKQNIPSYYFTHVHVCTCICVNHMYMCKSHVQVTHIHVCNKNGKFSRSYF